MHPDYRRNRILSHGPQSLPDSGARCPVPSSLVLMRGSVLHHSPCVVYRHAFQPDSLCIPKKSFLLFLGVTYPFVEQAECRCHRHRLVFLHHRTSSPTKASKMSSQLTDGAAGLFRFSSGSSSNGRGKEKPLKATSWQNVVQEYGILDVPVNLCHLHYPFCSISGFLPAK